MIRAGTVGTCLLLSVGALAAAAGDGPAFSGRLQMPTRTDTFARPGSVTADLHTGEVFVCDTQNHRIAVFDERGRFRYQIRGGDRFRTPLDVAVDADGYLFVLARRGSIPVLLMLDFDGLWLGEIELRGAFADLPPRDPVSLALSAAGDRLYLVDQDAQALWIAARTGHVEARLDLAEGLTDEQRREQLLGRVDVYGDTVLVANPTAGRILMLGPDGARRGQLGLKGTGSCQLGFPVAAALDRDGFVWVLDKQRALFSRWDPAENRCLSEHAGFGNADGALYQPGDLALDAEGRAYISQGFQARVQVFAGLGPAVRSRPPAEP